jgi:hypothetical protein
VVPRPRIIRRNIFLSNHGAGRYFWPVDHDDGAMYYEDTQNVYLYAGLKSGLGSHSIAYESSLLFWPDAEESGAGGIGGFSAGSNYQDATNASGYNEQWRNNTVLFASPSSAAIWYLGQCNEATVSAPMAPDTWPVADNNTFIITGGANALHIQCGPVVVNYSQWCAIGQDHASVVLDAAPSDDTLANAARRLLGLDAGCEITGGCGR